MTPSTVAVPNGMTHASAAVSAHIYDVFSKGVGRRRVAPATKQKETTAEKFQRLRAQWRAETVFLSSTTERISHPAYLAIVAMGEGVVPLLLQDLSQRPAHWGPALSAITGARPAPPSQAGDIRAITNAWLRWGLEHGYLK